MEQGVGYANASWSGGAQAGEGRGLKGEGLKRLRVCTNTLGGWEGGDFVVLGGNTRAAHTGCHGGVGVGTTAGRVPSPAHWQRG